jgi:hypothetical protein
VNWEKECVCCVLREDKPWDKSSESKGIINVNNIIRRRRERR